MNPVERVQTAVRTALDGAAVAPGAAVLVACSGGPDSVVLADVAAALAGDRLGPVTLLYVDHGLRRESAADGAAVRALAAQLGLACELRAVEVDRTAASLESAARDARYAAFDEVADALEADAVLTAHTASDQAETVLMRVIRGTGIAGLAGIPGRRGRFVRPLLGVWRPEIEAYLAARDLPVISDPMNRDARFQRVRVRRDLLPALRRENPAVDRGLVRLAASAAEQREALDYAAAGLLARARQGDGWRVPMFAEAPAAVAKRAIFQLLEPAAGAELGAAHLQAALELVRGPAAGSRGIDLPGGRLVREYDMLRVQPASPVQTEITVDGPDGPYSVRCWQPGDRMRPARLRGHSRKLSDLFTDAKVPRRLRSGARVVVRQSDGAIVWAEHLGAAADTVIRVTLTQPDTMASNKC